jgi:multidrug efflux pump subunit AcrA (membrane-fusion protein)
VILGLTAIGAAFALGALPRLRERSVVRQETGELAIPTVSVVHPERATPEQEIVLPGTVVAYGDTPIFARSNGYVQRWYVDIGARVKQGQMLALIETPEVDQQVQQAATRSRSAGPTSAWPRPRRSASPSCGRPARCRSRTSTTRCAR